MPTLPIGIVDNDPDHNAHHDAIHRRFNGAPVYVTDHGAVGDGVTDDTVAIQDAVNAASGGTVFFPAGIYGISGPITLPDNTTLVGVGAHGIYPNFTTDWQVDTPSWGSRASTIQYLAGNGAIFVGGDNTEVRGLILRSRNTARTTADTVFDATPSHFRFLDNIVQNMYGLAPTAATAAGGGLLLGNMFTGCTTVLAGVIVDFKIVHNTFTSLTDHALRVTSGGGLNLIQDNRFEWAAKPSVRLEGNSRQNAIIGNVFDAHATSAVEFNQTTDPNTVTGNIFWRNGRSEAGDYTDCHIRLFNASGALIEGNVFRSGTDDTGTAWEGPYAVLGLESCVGDRNRFANNDTRQGAKTSRIVVDRYSNSAHAVEFVGQVDLPAGADPNGAADDFTAALGALSKVVAGGIAHVAVHEARKLLTAVDVSNLAVHGHGSTAITLTEDPGRLSSMRGLHNITYGARSYTIRGGAQFADGQPSQWKTDGAWIVGQVIYSTAPTAGGSIGWVKTAGGNPDTWKTFGTIAA